MEPASELEQALEDIGALEESLPTGVMDSKPKKYAKKQWRPLGKLKQKKVTRKLGRKIEEVATTPYSCYEKNRRKSSK